MSPERLAPEAQGPEPEIYADALRLRLDMLAQEKGGWLSLAGKGKEPREKRRELAELTYDELFRETKGDFGLMKETLSAAFRGIEKTTINEEGKKVYGKGEKVCQQVLHGIGGLNEYHLNLAILGSEEHPLHKKGLLSASQLAQARKKIETSLARRLKVKETGLKLRSRLHLAREKVEQELKSFPTARQELIREAAAYQRKQLDKDFTEKDIEFEENLAGRMRIATQRYLLEKLPRRLFLKRAAITAATLMTFSGVGSALVFEGRGAAGEVSRVPAKGLARTATREKPEVVFVPTEETPKPEKGTPPADEILAVATPPPTKAPSKEDIELIKTPAAREAERPVEIAKGKPEAVPTKAPVEVPRNPYRLAGGEIDFSRPVEIELSLAGKSLGMIPLLYDGPKGKNTKEFGDLVGQATSGQNKALAFRDKTQVPVVSDHSGWMTVGRGTATERVHEFTGEIVRILVQGGKRENLVETQETETENLKALEGRTLEAQQEGGVVRFKIVKAVSVPQEELAKFKADYSNRRVSLWTEGAVTQYQPETVILVTCGNLLPFDPGFKDWGQPGAARANVGKERIVLVVKAGRTSVALRP